MQLSVAIATYNEEDNIKNCLDSVSSWVKEIVIVDGGSDDKTLDIAQKYNAKIIKTDNPPNFHINKQKAINACTGDWILQLDADEVVTKELKEEILGVISQQLTANSQQLANGYWIPRKNYFLGTFLKKGGQYPDYTLRLYRNGKGRLPAKSVHEQAEVEGNTDYLHHPLLHYSYPNFAHYLDHFNRYTSIMATELEEKKVSRGIFSFLKFMIIYPKLWFLSTFIRHKGFVDGIPGFTFSLFSALRFPASYIKYWEKYHNKKSPND